MRTPVVPTRGQVCDSGMSPGWQAGFLWGAHCQRIQGAWASAVGLTLRSCPALKPRGFHVGDRVEVIADGDACVDVGERGIVVSRDGSHHYHPVMWWVEFSPHDVHPFIPEELKRR